MLGLDALCADLAAALAGAAGAAAPAPPGSPAEAKQVAALGALVGLAAGPAGGLLGGGWAVVLRTLSAVEALQACASVQEAHPDPTPYMWRPYERARALKWLRMCKHCLLDTSAATAREHAEAAEALRPRGRRPCRPACWRSPLARPRCRTPGRRRATAARRAASARAPRRTPAPTPAPRPPAPPAPRAARPSASSSRAWSRRRRPRPTPRRLRCALLRSRAGRVCWLRGQLSEGSGTVCGCMRVRHPARACDLLSEEQRPQQSFCAVQDAPRAVAVPARVTPGAARARSAAGRRGRRRAPRPCRPAGRRRRPAAPTPGPPSSSGRPAWPWCAREGLSREGFARSAQSSKPACHTHLRCGRRSPLPAHWAGGRAVRRPCGHGGGRGRPYRDSELPWAASGRRAGRRGRGAARWRPCTGAAPRWTARQWWRSCARCARSARRSWTSRGRPGAP